MRETMSAAAQSLIDRAAKLDPILAADIRAFAKQREFGLVFEHNRPEQMRLYGKPISVNDTVQILSPRGEKEGTGSKIMWHVDGIINGEARLIHIDEEGSAKECQVAVDDLVAVAECDQPIYAGLRETGRVERGGDKPYQVVINGENYHALEALQFCYAGKVDCIYIDPPYNTGDRDWKYNNDYVGDDDAYRYSKWLAMMERRLRIAGTLLNKNDSVLIVTIDEREYLRLGLLIGQLFREARVQMVSIGMNPAVVARANEFGRYDEYAFFVMFGAAAPERLELGTGWVTTKGRTHNRKEARWDLLRRSGTRVQRSDSPGCFYPIYAQGGRIVGVGNSLPLGVDRQNATIPDGVDVIWPIRRNKTEGNWQVSPQNLRELLSGGFVRLGKAKGSAAAVYYLKQGERQKIEAGVYTINGKAKDGSLIVLKAEDATGATTVPSTQWRMPSHDATQYGTRLLQRFFDGEKRFSFPKSLYAVEDCLRFFITNKPNALVVDFFAGSGTTAHAVMRLNHQDGGRRRCICITNNEVSAEEESSLTKRGLRKEDEAWEELGICRHVAVPRIESAITGKTPQGLPVKGSYGLKTEEFFETDLVTIDPEKDEEVNRTTYFKKKIDDTSVPDPFPMADGFSENAAFFDLTYQDPNAVGLGAAFAEIAPLLWMRAGCTGKIISLESDDFAFADTYGILFDYAHVAGFITQAKQHKGLTTLYVVTDDEGRYSNVRETFPALDVVRLYESYLRSFKIAAEGALS
jgi:adenine-specific DNA-methyltransferase